MTSRRATWEPSASCPADVAAAGARIVEHWRVQIECRRAKSPTARCDLTSTRGRLVESYLRGLYSRPEYTERELLDAITAYAAEKFHADNRAWRLLTGSGQRPGFLDDTSFVERWVNRGRAQYGAARRQRAVAQAEQQPEDVQLAIHQARMAAADARLAARIMDGSAAALEAAVLVGLPAGCQAICNREAGNPAHGPQPFTPTTANSRTLRAMVLIQLAREIEVGSREGVIP